MYPYVSHFANILISQEAAFVTKNTNEEMWKMYRRKADFNGSTLATTVGLSRTTSRRQLWLELCHGQRKEFTKEAKDRMRFGEDNEAWGIRELMVRTSNNNLIFWPTGIWTRKMDIDGEAKVLAATPDQIISLASSPTKDRIIVEVKMRKYDQHFPPDALPPDWYLQTQMEMYCTDTNDGLLWCFSGYSNTFRLWKIVRDDFTLKRVVTEGCKFLKEVEDATYSNYYSSQIRDLVERSIQQNVVCTEENAIPVSPHEIQWGETADQFEDDECYQTTKRPRIYSY